MGFWLWVSVVDVRVDVVLCRTQRDIMRDNMIVNMSGHAGKGTGMDMNIEHLIGDDKVRLIIGLTHYADCTL
jgi:hypothetical protein